jgi:hypothetical protein
MKIVSFDFRIVNASVKFSFFLIALLLLQLTSCNKEDSGNTVVTDIDGNEYHTITIGGQVWMVENLNVTRYRNGDTIPNIADEFEWTARSQGLAAIMQTVKLTGKSLENFTIGLL